MSHGVEYNYTIILTPAPEGGYTVTVPALPGCFTEGDTKEEAIEMAQEAISLYIAALITDGEPIPPDIPGASPIIETIKVVA